MYKSHPKSLFIGDSEKRRKKNRDAKKSLGGGTLTISPPIKKGYVKCFHFSTSFSQIRVIEAQTKTNHIFYSCYYSSMGNQKYLLQRQADTKGQPTGRDKIKILAQSSDFFFLFPPYSGQNTTHEKQKIRTRT